MNGANWLSGRDQPMYIDISCFVLLERAVMLKGGVFDAGYQLLDFENTCPVINAWVKRFQEHEDFKDHIIGHKEFDNQNVMQHGSTTGKIPLSNTIYANK